MRVSITSPPSNCALLLFHMSSRRDQIRMSDEEVFAFLEKQRCGVLGTVGPGGLPHMVNVGYLVIDRRIVFSSFAAAQKVKNVLRAGQASFLVEVAWPYNEIQGVLLSGPTTVDADTQHLVEVTSRIQREHAQMSGTTEGTPEIDVARHAPKRVVIYIEPTRIVSWDHRRLAGTY
jgi:PPOX class probable F420-dependent enzyme